MASYKQSGGQTVVENDFSLEINAGDLSVKIFFSFSPSSSSFLPFTSAVLCKWLVSGAHAGGVSRGVQMLSMNAVR